MISAIKSAVAAVRGRCGCGGSRPHRWSRHPCQQSRTQTAVAARWRIVSKRRVRPGCRRWNSRVTCCPHHCWPNGQQQDLNRQNTTASAREKNERERECESGRRKDMQDAQNKTYDLMVLQRIQQLFACPREASGGPFLEKVHIRMQVSRSAMRRKRACAPRHVAG